MGGISQRISTNGADHIIGFGAHKGRRAARSPVENGRDLMYDAVDRAALTKNRKADRHPNRSRRNTG
jgi:hypothetical protein